MRKLKVVHQCNNIFQKTIAPISTVIPAIRPILQPRTLSTSIETSDLGELVEYLEIFKNYEKLGVPKNAGTDSDDGFDLGRMRRLMDRLGNPQSNYKVVHIAGTKGKGSTAAFLSNILREEGYSVGCYTSPHIRTIRERMSLGRLGEPVSSNELCCLFRRIKKIIDEAVEFERGYLSHFEVLTAIAFTLFAEHNVNIAVVEAGLGGARDATNIITSSELATSVITTIGKEHLAALGGSLESIAFAKTGVIKYGCPVVLGGPFLPHIEQLIRDRACAMCSPLISASDSGNRSVIKGTGRANGKPCQSCDIVIQIEKEIPLSIELLDVNLLMLGSHQLQNAATATCAALCLRNQGWRISERSIRTGLEHTQLLGRSQFLTSDEVKALGLPGSMILLDGAHTMESAKALMNTIHMAFPEARLVLVVAMASDKDHTSFAREFLSVSSQLEAVCLTEVDIAGEKFRMTPASLLRDCWIKASKEQGVDIIHDGMAEYQKLKEDLTVGSAIKLDTTILVGESSLTTSLRIGDQILKARMADQSGIIVVTGSLHIVSSVLASVYG